jgi:hypothetical protein
MENERAIVKSEGPVLSPALQQLAEQISRSTIIPKEFAGSPSNCLIALEMAHRIGAGILQVMQSLYIVHGKPSWSGQFIIACVNSTKRFSTLRFHFNEDKSECYAFAKDSDGNELKGPSVSIDMAKKEGWWARNPKWQNMTELMMTYRAGTFFGRVYAPDVLMGMKEDYEVIEAEAVTIKDAKVPPSQTTKDIIADAAGTKNDEKLSEALEKPEPPKPEPEKPKKKETSSAKAASNSPSTPKQRLKVKAPLTEELHQAAKPAPEKVGPNRKALGERLAIGNFSEETFLNLANHNEWLGKGKQWQSMGDVPDGMFEVFLQPDEWTVVQAQLEKFK